MDYSATDQQLIFEQSAPLRNTHTDTCGRGQWLYISWLTVSDLTEKGHDLAEARDILALLVGRHFDRCDVCAEWREKILGIPKGAYNHVTAESETLKEQIG